METKLFVGNLNYSITQEQLTEVFSKFGNIVSLKIIQGKGFGFVEMGSHEEAEKAIQGTNGMEFEGRTMKVDWSKPSKPPRDRNFGNGGGGGFNRMDRGGNGGGGGGGRRFGSGGGGGGRPRRDDRSY